MCERYFWGVRWLTLRCLDSAPIGACDCGMPVNFRIELALDWPRTVMIADVSSVTTRPIDG
jgi:hypothetical protein